MNIYSVYLYIFCAQSGKKHELNTPKKQILEKKYIVHGRNKKTNSSCKNSCSLFLAESGYNESGYAWSEKYNFILYLEVTIWE